MITIQGMKKEPAHWPGSLKQYGTNPYGESIYRLIWSESRLHLIGGHWPDGSTEYRWVPLYPIKAWVLEKWLSAQAYAGSPESWEVKMKDESGLLACGPYPSRGEYDTSFIFPGQPTSSAVADVIGMIEAGRNYGRKDNELALIDQQAKKDKAQLDRGMDIFHDAQGAFNNRMTNLNPSKLTADKMVLKYSAQDLHNMPKGDNKFFAGKRK